MDQTRSSVEATTDRANPDSTQNYDVEAVLAREAAFPSMIDRYLVQSRVGRGGFGQVLLAFDPQLQRQIAIKIPRNMSAWKADQTDGFLHEARLAVRLTHPNVVTIHDVDTAEECGFYIAMEYVDGESLHQRLQHGRLTLAETADIMGGIAAAMQYAHKQGIIHRDLKPANVLIDKSGQVKVTDFGLAVSEEFQSQHAGDVSGTPAYMSPEQVRGEVHQLDGRSDIWSLGVILYECLTGRRPFQGVDWPVIREEILNRAPKPPRQIDDSIPPAVEAICLACLEKDPDRRPTIAMDVASQLREALGITVSPGGRRHLAAELGKWAGIIAVSVGAMIVFLRPSGGTQPPKGQSSPPRENFLAAATALSPDLQLKQPAVRREAAQWPMMKDFAFNYVTPGNSHYFDHVKKRYRIVCNTYAAFDAADQPNTDFKLEAASSIGETSHFGLLWNIQAIPAQPLNDRIQRLNGANGSFNPKLEVAYSACAAYFVAEGVAKTPCVRIGRLTFAGISRELTGVHEYGYVEEIPVEWDRSRDCRIAVHVHGGKLIRVIFQGNELPTTRHESVIPFDPNQPASVGIVGHETVDLFEFSLEHEGPN